MEPILIIPIILIAIIIDVVFGELPLIIHPVVFIGKIIDFFKITKEKYPVLDSKISGMIFTIFLILAISGIFALIIWLFRFNYILLILISSLLLSTTFSIKLLLSSANDIKTDLNHDLIKARKSVSYLVSRDTTQLSQENVISAVIETLTENITDSVVSPIFYTFILGVPGGIAYRVVNTLDAMIGYKNPKNINIGWFPAKLDDILNYLPARITGVLIVLAAVIIKLDWRNAYKIMIRDANNTPSPNSGYPMAATAGALGIQLIKPGAYQLGDNLNHLNSEKISETIQLTKITIILFLIFSTFLFFLLIIILIWKT
ncbi:MAG TPA: cobalamin biosynthesis protein [Methanobacterium sp.]